VRVASIGRNGNPTVPSLEGMLDAEKFSIQVIKVFTLHFSQHAVERYRAIK